MRKTGQSILLKGNFIPYALTGCTLRVGKFTQLLFDFWLSVKAAPYECVIRTGQPQT